MGLGSWAGLGGSWTSWKASPLPVFAEHVRHQLVGGQDHATVDA